MALNRSRSRWAGIRAAIRMARRDVWRNRGRSALIALMVALPVLAMSTASVLYRSAEQDPQDIVLSALGGHSQARISYQDGRPVNQDPSGSQGSSDSEGAAPKLRSDAEVRAVLEPLISGRDALVADVQLYA